MIKKLFMAKFGNKANHDIKNNEKIADALGFSVNNIIYMRQRHTDNILVIDEKIRRNAGFNINIPEDFIHDAMITDIPGILLSVRTADCAPVLFWDEAQTAVGAAHCGWKGTLQKLQVKTVMKMRELYGVDNLKAAIGPCIRQCCYEVSGDLYGDFVNTLGADIRRFFIEKPNGKYMCDLPGINKMLLLSGEHCSPLREEDIEVSESCTCCDENFFSHRRQGENRDGTHVSFIGITE